MKQRITLQVEILQTDERFMALCAEYYERGYKDWHILSAVLNQVLHLETERRRLGYSPDDMRRRQKVMDELQGAQFPANAFNRADMDRNLSMHAMTCLQRYGFILRNRRVKPEVVEKFLRERMMHFQLDIPHAPMFGNPLGSWPV
ncbi:MAG: hypothetical protein IPK32_13535 [Verrucomicrobiaceae bacterium]|nr:hypothetical protein [Verrucomicrobiaceae bacterium]